MIGFAFVLDDDDNCAHEPAKSPQSPPCAGGLHLSREWRRRVERLPLALGSRNRSYGNDAPAVHEVKETISIRDDGNPSVASSTNGALEAFFWNLSIVLLVLSGLGRLDLGLP